MGNQFDTCCCTKRDDGSPDGGDSKPMFAGITNFLSPVKPVADISEFL